VQRLHGMSDGVGIEEVHQRTVEGHTSTVAATEDTTKPIPNESSTEWSVRVVSALGGDAMRCGPG